MADRLKKLNRELGLAAAPAPFALDPKTVRRRVKKALTAGQAERNCYMRHKYKLTAILAAVLLIMTGTAVAAGPYVSLALQNALGVFSSYAQPLDGTVEDQGIRFRVVSALTDGPSYKVYAEVTDLTGDRLANAQFFGHVELSLEGKRLGFSSLTSLIDYDAEHKTALICIEEATSIQIPEAAEGTVHLSPIQPEYYAVSTGPLPAENIPDFYLETQTVENGKIVLCPGQNPAELENGNGVSISSMGFGGDGRLHFLLRFPEGTVAGTYRAFIPGAVEITNGSDEQSVPFSQDGVSYYDFSVAGDLSIRDSIEQLSGVFGQYVTAETIVGKWSLPIQLEKVESQASPISGDIGRCALTRLTLSPLSAVIHYTSQGSSTIAFYPLAVFLSDGSCLVLDNASAIVMPDVENLVQWDFDRPVDVGDITGVALGQWMIPVQDGTAGEGYWLAALPEATE